MNYEREISNQLRRLGVNNSYVGFRYTIYGVARTIHDPTLLAYISKGLYVDISGPLPDLSGLCGAEYPHPYQYDLAARRQKTAERNFQF